MNNLPGFPKCDECGETITSELYWKRWYNGKRVAVCNRCAANMIDDRSCNGLVYVNRGENDAKDGTENM